MFLRKHKYYAYSGYSVRLNYIFSPNCVSLKFSDDAVIRGVVNNSRGKNDCGSWFDIDLADPDALDRLLVVMRMAKDGVHPRDCHG